MQHFWHCLTKVKSADVARMTHYLLCTNLVVTWGEGGQEIYYVFWKWERGVRSMWGMGNWAAPPRGREGGVQNLKSKYMPTRVSWEAWDESTLDMNWSCGMVTYPYYILYKNYFYYYFLRSLSDLYLFDSSDKYNVWGKNI